MSFLKSILGTDQYLGVDIGTTSIKMAELVKIKEQLRLLNYGILETYGYLERFNEAIQTSSLKLSEKNTGAYLKLLLERAQIKTKSAIASVPAFLAYSTLIEPPVVSEGEIKKFMEYQAKQYIPLPLNQVTLDWIKVGERTDENGTQKFQILLVSIPNEQILKYQNIFHAAGLKLTTVEIEGMSLARVLSYGIKEPTLIIDIGSRSTGFSIVAGGFLKFSGQTDFSGGSLTQVIANGLGIGQRRAEDLKKQRGLTGFGGEHELSTLILPILDVIISEAKRVLGNYESSYGDKVTSIVLSGGGSFLVGIEDYFNQHSGLPTKKGNAFQAVSYPAVLEPIVKDTGPLLSVAIGLGMKGFID